MFKQTNQLAYCIKRVVFAVVAIPIVFITAMPYAYADGDHNESCAPVATPPVGIQHPTGADENTFSYNSCSGLWENNYYTWDPSTHALSPKQPLVYRCDTSTWSWATEEWMYDAAAGTYKREPVTVTQLPKGATIAADSLSVCAPQQSEPSVVSAAADPQNGGTSNEHSSQSAPGDQHGTSNPTATNNAVSTNQIGQNAATGDSVVSNNSAAGNASTGNADATENVINSVQSPSALSTGGVTTFTANINGDVQGNLLVDPSQLQPAADNSTLDTTQTVVNSKDSGQIDNNINVGANSGSAAVAHNTAAGNASSGNAAAIANVVNMLDTLISAGKSFVGVININGNMNGDILIPPNFVDSLIASNAPHTTMDLSPEVAQSFGISSASNQAIDNSVSSSATSGQADVADNTQAGSAATGDTGTKVTVFNLTGNQVVGANCLLVFVNVSGSWVGVIMNAPAGATAAALGGGLMKNTVAPTNASTTAANTIDNKVHVAAASGNADVFANSSAGNAKSGNANTAVNLLNMDDTQFNLSGWFGILFINVFGNWIGSFKSESADPAHTMTNETDMTPHIYTASRIYRLSGGGVFQYEPDPSNAQTSYQNSNPPIESGLTGPDILLASATGAVFGYNLSSARIASRPVAAGQSTDRSSHNLQVVGGILAAAGLSTLVFEQVIGARRVKAK